MSPFEVSLNEAQQDLLLKLQIEYKRLSKESLSLSAKLSAIQLDLFKQKLSMQSVSVEDCEILLNKLQHRNPLSAIANVLVFCGQWQATRHQQLSDSLHRYIALIKLRRSGRGMRLKHIHPLRSDSSSSTQPITSRSKSNLYRQIINVKKKKLETIVECPRQRDCHISSSCKSQIM